MKKNILILVIIAFAGISYTACSSNQEKEVDRTGVEYTSSYICPMHCEGSGSEHPGNCPDCGMKYVENPDSTSH